jgi:hypothetical protein
MGTVSLPEVKRPGRGVNHPRTFNADVKQKNGPLPVLPVCAFMAGDGVKFAPFWHMFGIRHGIKIRKICQYLKKGLFLLQYLTLQGHTSEQTLPRSLHLLPSKECTQNLYLQHRSNCETDNLLYSSAPVIDTALKKTIYIKYYQHFPLSDRNIWL